MHRIFFITVAAAATFSSAHAVHLVRKETTSTIAIGAHEETSHASAPSYEDFLMQHGHRTDEVDAASNEMRKHLYHTRTADVAAHNAQRRSWKARVNKFADFTNEELTAMLGYKRGARSLTGPTSSFLELEVTTNTSAMPTVAAEIDWRPKLSSAKFFRDQGSCGSCWAVAATGALEMQAEMKTGKAVMLSYQQLVDCVPNPQHCGGTGGCEGATAELAFDYVQQRGLGRDDDWASGTACDTAVAKTATLATSGWKRLPTNKGEPLMRAITQTPVVVSVDGTNWFGYDSGVFDGCEKDSVVNHAVLAVGYGKEAGDSGKSYWLIRNSWGEDWGDHGHIKILRHARDGQYCGIDNNPKEGVGCDGGPAELPVCGMCGILSDSSHPTGSETKL
jgi:cathepsin L